MVMLHHFYVHGFMLLSTSDRSGYYGVYRDAFVPEIPLHPDYFYEDTTGDKRRIWYYTPPGWRQDAYKIYEDNQIEEAAARTLYLISNYEAAKKVHQIIMPHVGVDTYRLFECIVATADLSEKLSNEQFYTPGIDYGYDVAYTGGDMYSAIFVEFIGYNDKPPKEEWADKYKSKLNEYKLFSSVTISVNYLEDVRRMWKSDADSDWGIYRLRQVKA